MSRPPRRRGRRGAPPPPGASSAPAPASSEQRSSGYGRAALIFALLLGTLVERAALSLPDDARNIFHFIVVLGIALLVARVYRAFARRAIERRRSR